MTGAFLEIFAHTPQPLFYFAWNFSQSEFMALDSLR